MARQAKMNTKYEAEAGFNFAFFILLGIEIKVYQKNIFIQALKLNKDP